MGKVQISRGFDPKFTRHRYLVASRAEADFYEGDLNHNFHFLERISNPEARLSNFELLSDRPGRAFARSRSGVSHGYEHDVHEEKAKQFAQKIGHILDAAAGQGLFSDLVILAEPHFLGLIQLHLSERVKALVRQNVAKEWARGSDQELEQYLREKLA